MASLPAGSAGSLFCWFSSEKMEPERTFESDLSALSSCSLHSSEASFFGWLLVGYSPRI